MRPAVTYSPYCTSLREQPGDIIMFTQFEEGNIWTKTRNDAESGDESDTKSTMMSEQDMENINSGDESDHDLILPEMLEEICGVSQNHPKIDRKEARYKYVIVLGKYNRNEKEQ